MTTEWIHFSRRFLLSCKTCEGYAIHPGGPENDFSHLIGILFSNLLDGPAKNDNLIQQKKIILRVLDSFCVDSVWDDLVNQNKVGLQLLCFALSAHHVVFGKTYQRLLLDSRIQSADKVTKLLKKFGVLSDKAGSGNLAMFLGILLWQSSELCSAFKSHLEVWEEYHISSMDESGLWGGAARPLLSKVQNGYHQYEVLSHLGYRVPYCVAKTLVRIGLTGNSFAPYPGGDSCYDYDAIYLISLSEEKSVNEISRLFLIYSKKWFPPHGTTGDNKTLRPRFVLLMALFRLLITIRGYKWIDYLYALRRTLALFRFRHDKKQNHFHSGNDYPWGEPDLWTVYFRFGALVKLGLMAELDSCREFEFIHFPGVGSDGGQIK